MSTEIASQLALLGWDTYFQEKCKPFAVDGYTPARITADFGAEYLIQDTEGTTRATAGRHLRNDALLLPAVGDWVALLRRDPVSAVHGVVERRTVFSRKVSSRESKDKVMDANG